MKPTSAQLRQLRKDNLGYPPRLVDLPPEKIPPLANGPFNTGSVSLRVMRSRTHCVVLWQEPNGFHRLSVNRTEWDERQGRFRDDISWDDLQRLKEEAGYGAHCAVEVYPPDAAVVNVANMRHLFLLDSPPPFMWKASK